MKKGLGILAVLILLIACAAWYLLSNAGELIRVQIEQQGSQYLGTTVKVSKVDLALTEGRMTISGLSVANPKGFSQDKAFSIDSITLDLGEVINEPYVVQTINIHAPAVLYEVDAQGQGNLIALKNNLVSSLPKTENQQPAPAKEGLNPLVMIEDVTISHVALKLNFEKLPTGDLNLETKTYEVSLPTFKAGSIGKPNGMPANKVGIAVAKAMLDNLIAAGKAEAKKRLAEEAKKKVSNELDKHKDKLLEKANDKLKGLFN